MAWSQTDRDAQVVPYVYCPFPKHVSHVSGDGRWKEVADEAAWIALGPEWGHASFSAPPAPPQEPAAEPGRHDAWHDPLPDMTRQIRKPRKARA